MTTTTEQTTRDRCVEHAKTQINQLKEGVDLSPLDVRYTVSASGDVREITLVTATGGPQVELKLVKQVVNVYWGNDEVNRVIRDKEAQQRCEQLTDQYEAMKRFKQP